MSNSSSSGLVAVLHADAAATDRADKLALYGQFVGDWEADIVTLAPDGARHAGEVEIHFGWVLEGRAVQDVWMIPRRKDRHRDSPGMPIAGNWYGTTLRIYDPALDAWRIYWIDPATNIYRQQIGRAQSSSIVQEGLTETGALSRWSFHDITPSSFRWEAEVSDDQGASWFRLVEISARRIDAAITPA
jgi:hypothetical protein